MISEDHREMRRGNIESLKEIFHQKRGVNLRTLEKVIMLAIEIAREGREGRKVGTLFIVSDSENTMKSSRCLILDPLLYHPDEKKHIENQDLRETIKELAQLDGAFIVSDAGIVISACRHINTTSEGINLPLGLGSRHMAAASITKRTKAVAVVVSESSIVRVFDDGELIAEILPELWLRKDYSLSSTGAYPAHSGPGITAIRKKQ